MLESAVCALKTPAKADVVIGDDKFNCETVNAGYAGMTGHDVGYDYRRSLLKIHTHTHTHTHTDQSFTNQILQSTGSTCIRTTRPDWTGPARLGSARTCCSAREHQCDGDVSIVCLIAWTQSMCHVAGPMLSSWSRSCIDARGVERIRHIEYSFCRR